MGAKNPLYPCCDQAFLKKKKIRKNGGSVFDTNESWQEKSTFTQTEFLYIQQYNYILALAALILIGMSLWEKVELKFEKTIGPLPGHTPTFFFFVPSHQDCIQTAF